MTDEELGLKMINAWYDACISEKHGHVAPAVALAQKARALLSPPASNAPILRMSKEQIISEFRQSWCDYSLPTLPERVIDICARVAHRLAQPVPEVDKDDKARRLAWDFHNVKRSSEIRAGITQTEFRIWPEMHESERDAWRAVAAAQEKSNG